MKIIHQYTEIHEVSRIVQLCLLSRVMLSHVECQIMPNLKGSDSLICLMVIYRVGTWPLAIASWTSRIQTLGVPFLPTWLPSGLSPTLIPCILTEIRLSTPHELSMSVLPPPNLIATFLKIFNTNKNNFRKLVHFSLDKTCYSLWNQKDMERGLYWGSTLSIFGYTWAHFKIINSYSLLYHDV